MAERRRVGEILKASNAKPQAAPAEKARPVASLNRTQQVASGGLAQRPVLMPLAQPPQKPEVQPKKKPAVKGSMIA
jgi:hypothetical protein